MSLKKEFEFVSSRTTTSLVVAWHKCHPWSTHFPQSFTSDKSIHPLQLTRAYIRVCVHVIRIISQFFDLHHLRSNPKPLLRGGRGRIEPPQLIMFAVDIISTRKVLHDLNHMCNRCFLSGSAGSFWHVGEDCWIRNQTDTLLQSVHLPPYTSVL